MADPDPVSNGRTSFGKVGWNNTPGDKLAITVTLPAINGNSRTFRLSITCPIDPVDVSSSGASAVTWTLSVACPISIVTSIVMRSSMRVCMRERTHFLKPGADTVSE